MRDEDTGKPLAGMMVHGESSAHNPFAADIRSITDAEGHYRVVGLTFGHEGHLLAVPPCDFPGWYVAQSRAQGSSRLRASLPACERAG